MSIFHKSIDSMPYIFNKSLRQNFGQLKSTKFLKLLALTNTSMKLMNFNCHAKELKGIGGMAIFNLLCKGCCQVKQSCSFRLKTV